MTVLQNHFLPFLFHFIPTIKILDADPGAVLTVIGTDIPLIQRAADFPAVPNLPYRVLSEAAPSGRVRHTAFDEPGKSCARIGHGFLDHFVALIPWQLPEAKAGMVLDFGEHGEKCRMPGGFGRLRLGGELGGNRGCQHSGHGHDLSLLGRPTPGAACQKHTPPPKRFGSTNTNCSIKVPIGISHQAFKRGPRTASLRDVARTPNAKLAVSPKASPEARSPESTWPRPSRHRAHEGCRLSPFERKTSAQITSQRAKISLKGYARKMAANLGFLGLGKRFRSPDFEKDVTRR